MPPEQLLSKASLCYEFQGIANTYFNFLSNNCTSINAHYTAVLSHPDVNIIDEVAIHTMDLTNQCINISVNIQCAVTVNGAPMDPNQKYANNSVTVTQYRDAQVQVAIPSCSGGQSLTLLVYCQSVTLLDLRGEQFSTPAMRVVVKRSLYAMGGGSHGLLGKSYVCIVFCPYCKIDYITTGNPSATA